MDITKAKKLSLPLRDVYQFLISELRYGYTRNNHLMPGDSYEKVKRIIPEMYKVDEEYAVYTLKQLCEECISGQLTVNFYDGEDDEFRNRKEAIDFIEWSLDWIHQHNEDPKFKDKKWLPYCYESFLANLKKDDEPRYNIYEVLGNTKKLLTEKPVCKKDYLDIIFEDAPNGITYRLETHKVSDDPRDLRRHYTYHLLSPVRKDFYIEHI